MTNPPASTLREEDLRMDVYTNASSVGTVTLTHIPTGLSTWTACGPGCAYVSQHKARVALMELLARMVAEHAALSASRRGGG